MFNRMRLHMLTILLAPLWLAAGLPSAYDNPDPEGRDRLVAAYPGVLEPSTNANSVRWTDGTEMVYDDGVRESNYEELLDKASLADQMALPYPAGWPFSVPEADHDPGRVRHEPFFRKLYGSTPEEVESRLVSVPWPAAGPGASVRFNERAGAAEALGRVAAEIEGLSAEARAYVTKPNGTYVWRPIAGTGRLSMHSFGIAIDFQLPSNRTRYWLWDEKAGRRTFPEALLADEALGQIVRAFEKHGFIWGGKWDHYDTMHFEYRPELLPPP